MYSTFARLFTVLVVLAAAPAMGADDAKPAEGALQIAGKTYKLAHAVAYETKFFDEPAVAVLAADRPIDVAQIKAVLKENDGDDGEVSLRTPHVKITFDKAGKAVSCSAYAAGFSSSTSGDDLTGEIKLDAGQATGKAKLAKQGEGEFERSFEFSFATGLLGSAAERAPQAAPLAKLGVSGTFKGNGKNAKLAHVSARLDEPFNDKPGLVLVFTEKDHSKDKKPDFKAGFGDYGSALIISCHEDGSIYGCQVAHAAHEKGAFSSIGKIETMEFQIAGGQVQGKLTTGGEDETFGQTWEVDLTFAAPYKSATTTAEVKPAAKNASKPAEPQPDPKPAAPPAEKLNVKELAILKGVEGVEYKTLVEHVSYKSATNYKALAGEIAKQLAAQGWKAEGRDLVGVSAIITRKRGDASLTIFVKPAEGGSTVTIFTEGLSWEE